MAKKSKLNIPTLPEKMETVRSILREHGVLDWKENVVGELRIDISCLVPSEQETKILFSIPHDAFAIRGIVL